MSSFNSQTPESPEIIEMLARINSATRQKTFSYGNFWEKISTLRNYQGDPETKISITATQKRALLIAAACAVALSAVLLFSSQAKPRVTTIKNSPQIFPTNSQSVPPRASLVVDVQGEVKNPGVYQLPEGSRVGDAIKAAGGIKKGSSSTSVNLARFLEDGEQIYVAETFFDDDVQSNSENGSIARGRLNLNRATENELDGLPGVGPVLAKRISAYRAENGSFSSIDELQKVSGIGPAKFNELRNFVTV